MPANLRGGGEDDALPCIRDADGLRVVGEVGVEARPETSDAEAFAGRTHELRR
jgi:hypothetical protein